MRKLKLNLTAHPLANLFPLMSDEEYAELKRDIAAHGQIELVTLHEGAILDGRNRYRACMELGITPNTETFHANGLSALDYVIAKNLKRRHLSESQRAMIAAKLATNEHGGNRKNQSANLHFEPTGQAANLPLESMTQARAAEMLNVSERSVRDASKVKTHGAPALIEAVEQGGVAVSTAALIADAPTDEQNEIIARGEKEIHRKSKELRAARREERRAQRRNDLEVKAAEWELLAPNGKALDQTHDATRIQIICADSRRLKEYIPDSTIDLIVTSPPYNQNIPYRVHNDDLNALGYEKMILDVLREAYRILKPGGRIALVVPAGVGRDPYIPFAPKFQTWLDEIGFTLFGEVVWDKGQHVLDGRTTWGSFRSAVAPRFRDRTERIEFAYKNSPKLDVPKQFLLEDERGTYTPFLQDANDFMHFAQDVWIGAPESAQRIGHPAPFPLWLAEHCIRFLAYPNATIADLWGGSGTTAVASKKLGCAAIHVDIDAAYCKLARERLEALQ